MLRRATALGALLLALLWADAGEVRAQRFQIKWINVGDFQSYYSEGGIEPRRNPRQGLQWPAIMPETHHFVRKALWIAVTDWTSPEGETWEHKIAHVGPRMQGEDEFFPIEFKLVSRFEPPEVTVDEFQSFDKPVFVDEIDPDLPADRMIYNKLNTLQGITVERRVYAFSQEYHDDYHIWEYVLTNTGNVDGDDEIELPDQTLTGLYAGFLNKYTINVGAHSVLGNGVSWGKNQITDVVGDGLDNYDVDFRAMYTWHGRIPEFTQYNNIGGPIWTSGGAAFAEGDTVGRLAATGFIGRVFLHEDRSATDESDHPDQPSTMITYDSGQLTSNNDAWNRAQMAVEYNERLAAGIEYPHHADQIVPPAAGLTWRERFARQSENAAKGINAGIVPMHAYGPYTLGPGEDLRIVFAEGVSGLPTLPSVVIGKAYKRSGGDDDLLIEYDADGDGVIGGDERMTKNEWVMTGRDSLFQMFRRARANYQSGYAIPQPPLPPKALRVTSGTDRITLGWDTYAGAQPEGWEIYRARNLYQGAVEDNFQYELVAELPAGQTSYEDTEVIRGIPYYYYVQSVGPVNTDDTGLTPTGVRLKSSRYYAQTYDPAILKREPGASLENARVVPNPYNLAAAQDLRWPEQDRLAFLEIPGECTIRIYTERGDLVETIEHLDGSGDAYWDLTTSANQVVVSGLYIAVIIDHATGEQIAKKFFVIR